MFSGIVKATGKVKTFFMQDGIADIAIVSKSLGELNIGDSVAIDGCCQTIIEIKDDWFKVQAVKETLSKTNFNSYITDTVVNLEPSLRVNDKLDGHLVSGHVDGTGQIARIANDGENQIIEISHPESFGAYIAPKGSIAVNGVSLTVIESKNDSFSFTLIPFTRTNTNLGKIKIGDEINLEVDLVSRYLVNFLEKSKQLVAK